MKTGIVDLESDHPGFNDPEYRARRHEIATLAFDHKTGEPAPRVKYTTTENATWKVVYSELKSLFPTHACTEYIEAFSKIGFQEDEIPQLEDVNQFLKNRTGFHLEPVYGLVEPRDFLSALARRVFPSTQYIRHHSVPHYTPEPDIVHELLGHIPMLATPDYADLSQALGKATVGASDDEIERFARLYWYTIEFGLTVSRGERRAYGAGLLSSYGELSRAVSPGPDGPDIKPFDVDVASALPNPITTYQPVIFEAKSVREAFDECTRYIEATRSV